MYLLRSRKRKLLDTVKRCQEQSDKNFQKIMLAELPVKSGLRSYGGLLLSGYFVKDDSLTWKGVKRLLVPYFFWTIIWFSETTITGSIQVTFWSVINSIFLGGAFFPLYFLSVLLQLKLLTPLLYRRINSDNYHTFKDVLWLLTPAYFVLLYILQFNTGKQPSIYAQVFPAWFIFYYAGIYISKINKEGKFLPNKLFLFFSVLIALYLCIVEAAWLYDDINIPFFAASQLKFSSALYSFIICLLLVSLYGKVKRNIVCEIGEMSMGIFIIHIPVKSGIEILIKHIPASFQNGIICQLMVVFATVILCYVIISIADRLLPKSVIKYIGLK